MRKKLLLCLLTAFAVLAAGCGEAENAGDDAAAVTEENAAGEVKDSASSGGASLAGTSRLVSVEDTEDYITLGEYKGIVLQKSMAEVTDEDVENGIAEALKDYMETVSTKNATVQEGDLVTISYVGRMDGEAFDGGTGDTQDLLIGSQTMIPGFEDGIIGMKAGETKYVDVTFPESYSAAELAGKPAVFEITLQSFKRAPELTEEWVTENTDYASVDEYRAGIRAQLEQEAESSLETTAWLTVYGSSEVLEYPGEDLDEASASFRSQIEAYAGQADMTLEEYVESQGMTADDFESLCTQYARQKVKQNLVIQAIMDAEGMTLEDEESLAIQEQLVSDYGAGDLAALVDACGQEAVDESIGLIRVRDFILANANIEQGAQETTDLSETDTEVSGTTDLSETDTEVSETTDLSETDTEVPETTVLSEDTEASETTDLSETGTEAPEASAEVLGS